MRRIFIQHKIITVSVISGAVLLLLTLLLGVNPAESSVTAGWVLATPLWWMLAVSSFPALIAGVMLGGFTVLMYPLMFLIQCVLYWLLGRIIVYFRET